MSITTYAELQSAITNWLGGRTDLTTYYPDWITLFEAYAMRKLKVRPMETTTTLTTSAGSVALPADYLGWRRLTWTGSSVNSNLDYVHPTILYTYFPTSPAGVPTMFTIQGNNLIVRPTDDTAIAYTLLYYAKTGPIASATQWLFTNHPDVYLFGALAESGGFTNDVDKLVMWKGRRDEIMDEIQKMFFREGGARAVRVVGYTP